MKNLPISFFVRLHLLKLSLYIRNYYTTNKETVTAVDDKK